MNIVLEYLITTSNGARNLTIDNHHRNVALFVLNDEVSLRRNCCLAFIVD